MEWAYEELMNIIEEHIISKKEISSESIQDLIFACERELHVDLREFCNPISLLQDVNLRICKSRYLDDIQKQESTEHIKRLINAIKVSPEKIAANKKTITQELANN